MKIGVMEIETIQTGRKVETRRKEGKGRSSLEKVPSLKESLVKFHYLEEFQTMRESDH